MEYLSKQNKRELPNIEPEEQERLRAEKEAKRLKDLRDLYGKNPQIALRAEAKLYYPGVPMKLFNSSGEKLPTGEALLGWRQDLISTETSNGVRKDGDTTDSIDGKLKMIKQDLGLEKTVAAAREAQKNPDYINLSPEVRQTLIQELVGENKGSLVLQEVGGVNGGAGYLGYNIISNKVEGGAAQEINRAQAEIGQKFVDSITAKLQKFNIDPKSKYGISKWEKSYGTYPDEIVKFLKDSYGSFLDAFDFKSDDPAIKFLDEKFGTVAEEFKIHLQPKKESIPVVLKELVEIMGSDKDLQDSISQFKVALSNDTGSEVFPEIVIYPKLTKQDYLKVLKALSQKFNSRADELGSGDVPRRNSNLNKLVNVAQSGGDFKKMLDNLGLLDKYFDKSRNYGFAVAGK